MKERSKKILALFLATAMSCIAITGCGNQTTVGNPSESEQTSQTSDVSSETDAGETTGTAEAAPLTNVDIYPLDSDTTFKVVQGANSTDNFDNAVVPKVLEKATGVSIDYLYWTPEQFKLALSSKELPDAMAFMYGSLTKGEAYDYGKAGYFVNFMDYLDIMPNFKEFIEKYPEALKVVQNEDGSVYNLPMLNVGNTSGNNILYYRTDMMKEIGWENPPATTDEFLEYIVELQKHFGATDPDYVAFNAYRASNISNPYGGNFSRFLFTAFGELTHQEITVNSKDEVVVGFTTEQYKHFLEFMNEVWNSGAFSTDVFTEDGSKSQVLNAGSHIGVCPNHTGLTLDSFESGNFDLAVMPALTSEYWDTPQWYMAPASRWNQLNMISTSCPDVETMVRWFDALYASKENPLNEEGTVWGISTWLGEIGVDFVFDDENMSYKEQEHEGIETGTFMATQGFSGCIFNGFEDGRFTYVNDPNTNTGVKGIGISTKLWPVAVTPVTADMLTLTTEESDIYKQAWSDITVYAKDMSVKFITGEESIEQSWDTYISTIEKMGLDKVIDVHQAAYERYKAE